MVPVWGRANNAGRSSVDGRSQSRFVTPGSGLAPWRRKLDDQETRLFAAEDSTVRVGTAQRVSGALGRSWSIVEVVLEDRFPGGQELVEQRIGEYETGLASDDFGLAFGDVREAERGGPSESAAQGNVVA